ncbi:DUF6328 family protein [Streptomyces luteireticuli]|uniref:DUF6328 family protein n=1 Tax=Streptomyces luteireticuli TaxID=173858 RepID=UPI003558BDA7
MPTDGEPGARQQAEAGDRDRDQRHETPAQRADRRWGELLQEVRVTQTGVQILFGFLLTVVFTPRFAALGTVDRVIYIVTVMLGAATTGALVGPVAFHRIVTGHRLKPQTVAWAARLTLSGVVLLLATVAAALLLILRIALHNAAVPWLLAAVVAWLVLCWFALPWWALRRYEHKGGHEHKE